jgi:hypothetical protein
MNPMNINRFKRNDNGESNYTLRQKPIALKTTIETYDADGNLTERQELTTAEANKTMVKLRGAKKQRAAKAVAPSSIKKIEVKKYSVMSMVQTLADSKISDDLRVEELKHVIKLVEVMK